MNTLFTSSGFLLDGQLSGPNGSAILIHSLPPFLRVLLTTDGTVTKSIESFFWEPLTVVNLGQKYIWLSQPAPVINKKEGERVLQRRVKLKGKHTLDEYVFAESLICTQYLSDNMRLDLEEGRVGIGELLRECGLETYREIISVGYDEQGEGTMFNEPNVWRTYRIVMAHHPLIQITESFPLRAYQ